MTSATRSSASRSVRRVFLYCIPASSDPTTMRRPFIGLLLEGAVRRGWAGMASYRRGRRRLSVRTRRGKRLPRRGADAAFGERAGAADLRAEVGRGLGSLLGDVGRGDPRLGERDPGGGLLVQCVDERHERVEHRLVTNLRFASAVIASRP